MKLLQINVVANSGSTGRIAEELGKLVINTGGESIIACGRPPSSSFSKLVDIGSKYDMYSHILETRLLDNHGFSSRQATKTLIKEIKAIDPDIIHMHNIHGYYLHIEILFAYLAKTGKPVVWTLHDCWAFTGHCVFYDFVGCSKWKTECHHCPQIHTYPKSWFRDNSRANYQAKKRIFNSLTNLTLVPVSDWQAGQLAESFLQNFPVKRIHNGINLSDFSPFHTLENPDVKKRINGRFIILGVANEWEKRKGLQDFIELSRFLDDDEAIVLIGLKKSQLKDLPQNVIGLQKTENIRELAGLYAAANVFFNPTWEDNFPTTNLEAVACGTPVITYSSGGSGEVLNEEVGYVVQKGDLRAAINYMKDIKKRGKSHYSVKCREFAVNKINKDDRFQEYLDLYSSVLNTAK